MAKYGSNFTLVLRSGVFVDQIFISKDENTGDVLRAQIIGWSDDIDERGTVTEVRGFTENNLASKPRKVFNGDHALLSFIGEGITLVFQNLRIIQPVGEPHTCTGSCIIARNANITLKNCRLKTPNSPCCLVKGAKGRLQLEKCKIHSSSASVLALEEGEARISSCSIKRCHRIAVEARELGSIVLDRCIIEGCNQQAVAIYATGKSLRLFDCIIRHCGHSPYHSAVLIQSGSIVLRKCRIEDNPADGIIVQQDTGGRDERPPKIIIQDCIFKKNRVGMGLHYGSGLLLNNEIFGNSGVGIFIRVLTPHEKLILRGNKLRDNWSCVSKKPDVVISSHSLLSNQVHIDPDNSFSGEPLVLSDIADTSSMLTEHLGSLGLK